MNDKNCIKRLERVAAGESMSDVYGDDETGGDVTAFECWEDDCSSFLLDVSLDDPGEIDEKWFRMAGGLYHGLEEHIGFAINLSSPGLNSGEEGGDGLQVVRGNDGAIYLETYDVDGGVTGVINLQSIKTRGQLVRLIGLLRE